MNFKEDTYRMAIIFSKLLEEQKKTEYIYIDNRFNTCKQFCLPYFETIHQEIEINKKDLVIEKEDIPRALEKATQLYSNPNNRENCTTIAPEELSSKEIETISEGGNIISSSNNKVFNSITFDTFKLDQKIQQIISILKNATTQISIYDAEKLSKYIKYSAQPSVQKGLLSLNIIPLNSDINLTNAIEILTTTIDNEIYNDLYVVSKRLLLKLGELTPDLFEGFPCYTKDKNSFHFSSPEILQNYNSKDLRTIYEFIIQVLKNKNFICTNEEDTKILAKAIMQTPLIETDQNLHKELINFTKSYLNIKELNTSSDCEEILSNYYKILKKAEAQDFGVVLENRISQNVKLPSLNEYKGETTNYLNIYNMWTEINSLLFPALKTITLENFPQYDTTQLITQNATSPSYRNKGGKSISSLIKIYLREISYVSKLKALPVEHLVNNEKNKQLINSISNDIKNHSLIVNELLLELNMFFYNNSKTSIMKNIQDCVEAQKFSTSDWFKYFESDNYHLEELDNKTTRQIKKSLVYKERLYVMKTALIFLKTQRNYMHNKKESSFLAKTIK